MIVIFQMLVLIQLSFMPLLYTFILSKSGIFLLLKKDTSHPSPTAKGQEKVAILDTLLL